MASNESFKQAIKAYLDKRAEEDSLFAPQYANEKKSIDECCSYIMGEARKRGNAVAISDEVRRASLNLAFHPNRLPTSPHMLQYTLKRVSPLHLTVKRWTV